MTLQYTKQMEVDLNWEGMMSKRCNLNNMIVMTATIILLFSKGINAAWWDNKDRIQVPVGAELVKEETRRIAGSDMEFYFYISPQDSAALVDFYRTRLTAAGWKEKQPLQDLAAAQARMPGLQIDSSLAESFAGNLVFGKENQLFIITFVPKEMSQDDKTRFSVMRGKLNINIADTPGDDFVPELLAKPKKEVVPVYEGAKLMNLSEQPGIQRATYIANDEIEPVISFYKAHMPDYGWDIISEAPLKRMEGAQADAADISRFCPSCAKNAAVSPQPTEMWTSELKFSDNKGGSCGLLFSQTTSGEQAAQSAQPMFKMTIVVVYYEEKKL
jgi:hypothetical protein